MYSRHRHQRHMECHFKSTFNCWLSRSLPEKHASSQFWTFILNLNIYIHSNELKKQNPHIFLAIHHYKQPFCISNFSVQSDLKKNWLPRFFFYHPTENVCSFIVFKLIKSRRLVTLPEQVQTVALIKETSALQWMARV